MKRINTILSSLCVVMVCSAQDNKTLNQGTLYVSPNTQVSTYFDFENESTGQVVNDGDLYFFGHYKNDGDFAYTTNSTTGYVVFKGLMPEKQKIEGNEPSYFYDTMFDKQAVDEHAFHLTNEIVNGNEVKLHNGVVLMDKANGGAFVFLKGAYAMETSDISHVNGEVTKEGDEAFKYPIGDGGYYRFASISAPAAIADTYTGEYKFENSNTQYPHSDKQPTIQSIDDKEYWIINQEGRTADSVLLTLSWHQATTPSGFYADGAQGLKVVRWDEGTSQWVDEGGIVDYAAQTVTTVAKVGGFGVFTLGMSPVTSDDGDDVEITEGVTPDGDGKNDYFIIRNINKYKNNVEIVNRWGRKVFSTENYDTNGNVFRGIAEGKGVINKGEKLPTGTYYYKVEYLMTRNGVNTWVKKVGFIHLETE